MTKTTNPLRLALEDALPRAGFSRKGDSWYRRSEEVVEVLNLQKSQYGAQYYLNYALWLLVLGEASFPREEKCHVRLRGEDAGIEAAQLRMYLDCDSGLSDVDRRVGLADLLGRDLLPFAGRCRTLDGLRAVYCDGRLKSAMINVRARVILDKSWASP